MRGDIGVVMLKCLFVGIARGGFRIVVIDSVRLLRKVKTEDKKCSRSFLDIREKR